MKKRLMILAFSTLVFGGLVTMTSCKKQIEEIIEKYTFDVRITNTTAEDLEIYDSSDDGKNWEHIGQAKAMSTTLERGFPVDNDVLVEARKKDGTVYVSKTFKESKHTELQWEIN